MEQEVQEAAEQEVVWVLQVLKPRPVPEVLVVYPFQERRLVQEALVASQLRWRPLVQEVRQHFVQEAAAVLQSPKMILQVSCSPPKIQGAANPRGSC